MERTARTRLRRRRRWRFLPRGASASAQQSATDWRLLTRRASVPSTAAPQRRRPGPKTADHIDDAIRAGQPRRLTLERDGADERREEATEGTQGKPGYDKDEYPPALSQQGGEGADVRLVPSSDNRGAGASMGNQLRRYCDGQPFRLATPRR